jgi:hypothetical protein
MSVTRPIIGGALVADAVPAGRVAAAPLPAATAITTAAAAARPASRRVRDLTMMPSS